MRKILITLALSASALGAAACSAQSASAPDGMPQRGAHGPHRGGAGMMMRADTNHDGVITRAEAAAEADQRFAQLDANHDGQVTPAEMQAHREAMRARMQERRMERRGDANDNGVLTKSEAEARALQRFDRMDANHDGRIDKTEIANMKQMHQMRRRGMPGGGMPGGDMPPPPPAGTDGQ